MSKRITIAFNEETGKFLIDYNGYVGNDCYREAEKVREELESLGIEFESQVLEKKEDLPQIPLAEKERAKERGE